MGFVPEFVMPEPGEQGSLDALFAALAACADALAKEVGLHLEMFPDPEAAILLYDRIIREIAPLRDLAAAVETAAVASMPRSKMQVGDLAVERTSGNKRTNWQHDRLAWAVVQDLAVDANGELDDAAVELIGMCRDRLINAAGISYWRVNQLLPLGVNPDDYCEKVPQARHLKITPIIAESGAA